MSDTHFHHSPLVKKNFNLQKVNQFTIHDTTTSKYTIGKLNLYFESNKDDSLHAFYDSIKRKFVVVNNNGLIKEIISGEGRGPSEIVRAAGFNFNDRNILVINDIGQQMLKFFSMDGKLVRGVSIENTRFPIIAFSLYSYDNKIYAPTADRQALGDFRHKAWTSRLATVFNYQGKQIDTLGMYDPSVKQNPRYTMYPVISIDKRHNLMISSQMSGYHIQIFDLKSEKRVVWFGRKPANYNKGDKYISSHLSKRKINEMSADRSITENIYATPKYILLYFETLTKAFFDTKDFNKKKGYIAIYDQQTHDYNGELRLPYILGDVADGKLYLIEDTNPDHYTVGVYEIQQG